MSAQKEEAKQRKRKSLKMALEKCMQRREAASTTMTTITTTTTITNASLNALPTNTTTINATLSPVKMATTEAITTDNSSQKMAKTDISNEVEALETTETETSMDTSAEVNASDMCESREEDLESETSITTNTAKDNTQQLQQSQRTENINKSSMDVMYDDKPLDFTTTPTKKLKVNDDNETQNTKNMCTIVIKETAKLMETKDTGGHDNDSQVNIDEKRLNKLGEESEIEKNAVSPEKSASMNEN